MKATLDAVVAHLSHEPAVYISLAAAALDVAVLFGAPISLEQKAGVIAVLTALGGVLIRSQVTPVR